MEQSIKVFAWRDREGGLLMPGGDKYPHIRLYLSRDSAIADLHEILIVPDDINPVLTEFDLPLEDCHVEEAEEDGP